MREILFRGKHKGDGDWVYGVPIQCYDGDWQICTDAYKYTVNPQTIGQYTGLKDKNGTKIFEGDIVEFATKKCKVVFENRYGTAYYGIVIAENETWGFDNMTRAESVKVIGNKYDNPELLKEVK